MKRAYKHKIFVDKNVFVIGKDRDYKYLIEKPAFLQSNDSFIATKIFSDETLSIYRTDLEKRGYKVKVFDLVNMKNSLCYNPFHYIRKDEDVITFVELFMQNTSKFLRGCDGIYVKLETALLQAICFYIRTELPEEKQNFSTVINLLKEASTDVGKTNQDSVLDVIMEDLRERVPDHIAVKQYNLFKSYVDRELKRKVFISCLQRLQPFKLSDIKELTCSDNIDLDSLPVEKTALFCIVPATNTLFNFLISILYGQLFELLTEYNIMNNMDGKPLSHIRFMLDDSCQIGFIPRLEEKISIGRIHGITWIIKYRSLPVLKYEYENEWESILCNIDSFIFLEGITSETYEYFSTDFNKSIHHSGMRLYGLKKRRIIDRIHFLFRRTVK